MLNNHVSAVFDNQMSAQQAIDDLRRMGVADANLSVVARHHEMPAGGGGGMAATMDAPVREVDADSTGKGLASGAGIGALLGLASAFIPGVGPFMAAGALAATIGTIGASTVAGAVVGGVTGAIGGALKDYGYNEHEARYYGDAIERGGYLVAVEPVSAMISAEQIREVLVRHGGRIAPAAI